MGKKKERVKKIYVLYVYDWDVNAYAISYNYNELLELQKQLEENNESNDRYWIETYTMHDVSIITLYSPNNETNYEEEEDL